MNLHDLKIENLLTTSAEQYKKVLHHTESLLILLNNCDYSRLETHTVKLQQLQDEARKQDEKLLPLLMKETADWKDNQSYQQRLKLMNSIVELNKVITPKIKGIMAVTSTELKKMSGGRTALAGYASQPSKQKALRSLG